MNDEMKLRIKGLEIIVQELHHNNNLMQFMSFNLHKKPFNLFNNFGLYWIWSNIMGIQIINFYKTIGKHEKFSFIKLINVAKENKVIVNYDLIARKTNQLVDNYEKTNFETVRSKYLAHQDLNIPEIKTDILTIDKFTQEVDSLFSLFCIEFNFKRNGISRDVIESFNEIFSAIDEYEKIKTYLLVTQLEGKTNVEISTLKKIISNK